MNPPLSVHAVRQILPALAQLIHKNNRYILFETCWALVHLTVGTNERIQEVVDAGVVPRLVALLDNNEAADIYPTLRAIGNIVSGSDSQIDSVLAAGACPLLAKLLVDCKMDIVREAARTVSNIAAGNAHFRWQGRFVAPVWCHSSALRFIRGGTQQQDYLGRVGWFG